MKFGPIASGYCGESRGSTRRAKRSLMKAAGYTTAPRIERPPHHHAERPRERAGSRRRVTRGSPTGDDPPEPPPPDSDLNRVWREALDRFETVEEYRVLADMARIRGEMLLRRGWAA